MYLRYWLPAVILVILLLGIAAAMRRPASEPFREPSILRQEQIW